MNDEYVTDPALLEQLNSPEGYVTDPALLEQLNAPDLGKTLGEKTWGEAGHDVSNMAGGVAGTAGGLISGAVGAIPGKEYILPGLGTYGAIEGFKHVPEATQAIKNFAGGATRAAMPPTAPVVPNPATSPAWTAGAAQEAAPAMSRALSMSPAAMLGAPYALAGMEARNIRANPNAPGYKDVPYAQMYRGEAPTQAKAGEGNRMKALSNMPFGGVTPQERAMLEQDMQMKTAIRKKAFEKVMGPVAPGSF